ASHPLRAAGSDDLGGPEPGVGAQGKGPGGAGAADAAGELVDEPLGSAGSVGRTFAHAQVQHLAGVGPAGPPGGVAKGPGVAVGGAALVVAVDLADGGVHVDGHRLGPRSGASGPRPGKDLLGGLVELADVAQGERAAEQD